MTLEPILCGSDTMSSVADEIREAIFQSGLVPSNPYGLDPFTEQCKKNFKRTFENNDLEIVPIISGTASNSLAISTICNIDSGILCHNQSHIYKDECGAPEFLSGGGKLIPVNSSDGKLNSKLIEKKLNILKNNHFKRKVKGVSITQLCENGTAYSFEELKSIGDLCKNNELYFHMDGARFSNALVFLNKKPSEITWKIGVDCLSLGATKNGAYAAEVIIFFNKNLIKDFDYVRKKTGHVIPRTKLITSQLNTWLKDDLWIKLAKKSNENAQYLRQKLDKISDIKFLYPTHGNEIFVEMPKDHYKKFKEVNIFPKLWKKKSKNVVLRFVASFELDKILIDEIDKRLDILKKVRNI